MPTKLLPRRVLIKIADEVYNTCKTAPFLQSSATNFAVVSKEVEPGFGGPEDFMSGLAEMQRSIRSLKNFYIREQQTAIDEALRNHYHSVPESENYEHFGNRIIKALEAITEQPYKTIAILSHGGPISFIFREVLKLGDVKIEDCGFVELEKVNGIFSVIKMSGIELKK